MSTSYELRDSNGGVPIKTWTRGVPVESEAVEHILCDMQRSPPA